MKPSTRPTERQVLGSQYPPKGISTAEEYETVKHKPQPKVVVNWHPIVGEPSTAYRRLCRLLFKKRGDAAGTHEAAGREECKDENEQKVPD